MRSARVTGGNHRAVEHGKVGGTPQINMAAYRRQAFKRKDSEMTDKLQKRRRRRKKERNITKRGIRDRRRRGEKREILTSVLRFQYLTA